MATVADLPGHTLDLDPIRSTIAHRIAYWEAKGRLHQSARPETSYAEPSIVALFNCILEKKKIGLETWLQDHPDIKRSTFLDWKAAASGKAVKRKVSAAKAQKFEAAIRRDAKELGLM